MIRGRFKLKFKLTVPAATIAILFLLIVSSTTSVFSSNHQSQHHKVQPWLYTSAWPCNLYHGYLKCIKKLLKVTQSTRTNGLLVCELLLRRDIRLRSLCPTGTAELSLSLENVHLWTTTSIAGGSVPD